MSVRSCRMSWIFKSPKYISSRSALYNKIYPYILFIMLILQEERQRALLQLQWRVMGDKPQEDQEVNSKKVGFKINRSLSLSLSLYLGEGWGVDWEFYK